MDRRTSCFTAYVPKATERLQVSDLPFPDPCRFHLRGCCSEPVKPKPLIVTRHTAASPSLPKRFLRGREVKGAARLCHSTAGALGGRRAGKDLLLWRWTAGPSL